MSDDKLSDEEMKKIKQIYKSMTNDLLIPISRVPSNINQDLNLYSELQLGKYIIENSKKQQRRNTETNENQETGGANRVHKNVSFNANVNTRVFTSSQPNQTNQQSNNMPDETLNLNVSDINLTSPLSGIDQDGQQQHLNQSIIQDNQQSQLQSDSGHNNSWLRFQQSRPGLNRNIELDQKIQEEMYQDAQDKKELEEGINSPESFKQCLLANMNQMQILQVYKDFKLRQLQANSTTNSLVEVTMNDSDNNGNSQEAECCSICRTPNDEFPENTAEQEMEQMVLNQCWHQFHTMCLVRQLKMNPTSAYSCSNCRVSMNDVDLNILGEFVRKIYGINSLEEFMQ